MALKALMLRKKLEDANKRLDALRAAGEEFSKREAELEAAIAEAETAEEKAVVEENVDAFEAEKAENEAEVSSLEEEIRGIESELNAIEEEQAPIDEPAPAPEPTEERKVAVKMNNRTKFFGMSIEERDAFLANDNVHEFLERARELGRNKRSVTGADLLIPTEVLDLIRQNIDKYSKLIKHVRLRPVAGKARQTVTGVIPEAVWTEMCATLNELTIAFTGVEVDGFKVGGYIPVCNALLEDSDINLATEIIDSISQGIGYALDKAIVFGTGVKMPIGIFTRLAETEDPENPKSTIPWADLHSTHILSIASNKTGLDFFKALLLDASVAESKGSIGGKFWVMNEATKAAIMAESLAVNAAGALVASVNNEMPVIGGTIETLDFIPANVIIGGYGEHYLLAERAGASLKSSEDVRFIEDQTVFKGTARYDGIPVIAESFVAIGIAGVTPSASDITFAPDVANFQ